MEGNWHKHPNLNYILYYTYANLEITLIKVIVIIRQYNKLETISMFNIRH